VWCRRSCERQKSPPIRKLNPVFEIGGRKVVVAAHHISADAVSDLGESQEIWLSTMTRL